MDEGSPQKDGPPSQMDEGSPKKDEAPSEKDGASSIWNEGSFYMDEGSPPKDELSPQSDARLPQKGRGSPEETDDVFPPPRRPPARLQYYDPGIC